MDTAAMNVESSSATVETKTLRSFVMTAQQVYERFEKLPLEQRKTVGVWALAVASHNPQLLLLPKASDSQGRPERWRILAVDTQRWVPFQWRRIVWIAVNAMVRACVWRFVARSLVFFFF